MKIETINQISLFDQIEDVEQLSANEDAKCADPITGEEEIEVYPPFDVGERVRAVINFEEDEDVESYYYLKDFIGKRGEILRVIEKPSLQYEVAFKDRVAFLYHHELLAGWPQ